MLIFLLGVLGFSQVVNSICLIRSTTETKMYWYQCSLSNDYLSEVDAAPIDVQKISFCNSKIGVIRNRSFVRLNSGLEIFQIYFSEISEIEENAFEGLVKLHKFEIVGSNLKIVKGSWFKGLANLKTITFLSNEINRIEDSFFTTVPALNILDVSQNNLNYLPVDSFGNFYTREFQTDGNSFSFVCRVKLQKWFNDKKIRNSYTGRNNMELPNELIDTCVKKLPIPTKPNEGQLRICIEKTLSEFLLPHTNYTTKQLCEYLENKPSPFLDCSK